ncbi:MAG: hypothetical protein KKD74_04125 [Bacteroidetes bacterium]|nr:hypothetical protein [Bacteroidota bacterium]
MKIKLMLTAFVFFAAMVAVQAQDKPTKDASPNAQPAVYIDSNNNGICDNAENGTRRNGNGNGQCLRQGRGQGRGFGWRNGRQGANCPRKGNQAGRNGRQGRNFIDNNNNGVCDRSEQNSK